MDLPIWLLCAILILLVAIFFVWMQGAVGSRLPEWEAEAKLILTKCGYTSIISPRVVRAKTSYTSGVHINGVTKAATVHLYTESDNNTLRSVLIHELAHIIVPTASHSDSSFQSVVEKLSLCYSRHTDYNPFLSIDPKYPCSKD